MRRLRRQVEPSRRSPWKTSIYRGEIHPINGVITPLNRVITPISHVFFGHLYGFIISIYNYIIQPHLAKSLSGLRFFFCSEIQLLNVGFLNAMHSHLQFITKGESMRILWKKSFIPRVTNYLWTPKPLKKTIWFQVLNIWFISPKNEGCGFVMVISKTKTLQKRALITSM